MWPESTAAAGSITLVRPSLTWYAALTATRPAAVALSKPYLHTHVRGLGCHQCLHLPGDMVVVGSHNMGQGTRATLEVSCSLDSFAAACNGSEWVH